MTAHSRIYYACGCLHTQCRCPGPHATRTLTFRCPRHDGQTFPHIVIDEAEIWKRREEFLSGKGPDPALDPVAFFGALGYEPHQIPEMAEQIRRDRERLIAQVWD